MNIDVLNIINFCNQENIDISLIEKHLGARTFNISDEKITIYRSEFKSEDIIQTVWGSQRENDQSLLKNMIYRLRKKLEEEAGETNLIQTWPGGYSFQED